MKFDIEVEEVRASEHDLIRRIDRQCDGVEAQEIFEALIAISAKFIAYYLYEKDSDSFINSYGSAITKLVAINRLKNATPPTEAKH